MAYERAGAKKSVRFGRPVAASGCRVIQDIFFESLDAGRTMDGIRKLSTLNTNKPSSSATRSLMVHGVFKMFDSAGRTGFELKICFLKSTLNGKARSLTGGIHLWTMKLLWQAPRQCSAHFAYRTNPCFIGLG